MNNSNTPTRVVSICEANTTLNQISSALEAQNEFELIAALDDIEQLEQDLLEAEVEIILIDHQLDGQSTMDLIDELALQFPDNAIIAILPNNDPASAQQVMLAGARAFLIQPFTQVNLLSTLRRVRDLQARRRYMQPDTTGMEAGVSKPIHTLAVFSPRGGVGCTSIATNLAIAMYQETGARVLLMEGKLFFGDLDVMLNLRTHNSLADLVPHASSMDETLVQDVVLEHISGIHTLLAPRNFQIAQGIHPKDLFSIITSLQRYFDFIFIDAGSYLSENTVTVMDAADKILLVISPDLASLHDLSNFSNISQSLAYQPEKIMLILNKAERPGGVKTSDIKSFINREIFAQIPDDSLNSMRSVNRGVPLLINKPRSKASRSYQTIAKQIINLNDGQMVTPPS